MTCHKDCAYKAVFDWALAFVITIGIVGAIGVPLGFFLRWAEHHDEDQLTETFSTCPFCRKPADLTTIDRNGRFPYKEYQCEWCGSEHRVRNDEVIFAKKGATIATKTTQR